MPPAFFLLSLACLPLMKTPSTKRAKGRRPSSPSGPTFLLSFLRDIEHLNEVGSSGRCILSAVCEGLLYGKAAGFIVKIANTVPKRF